MREGCSFIGLGNEVDTSSITAISGAAAHVDRLGECREVLWRVAHEAETWGNLAGGSGSEPAVSGLRLGLESGKKPNGWPMKVWPSVSAAASRSLPGRFAATKR